MRTVVITIWCDVCGKLTSNEQSRQGYHHAWSNMSEVCSKECEDTLRARWRAEDEASHPVVGSIQPTGEGTARPGGG